MSTITVVLADSDQRRLSTCMRLLRGARGIKVVATGRSVREAVETTRYQPHIFLLDLKMTKASDAPAIPLIRTKSPKTRIILLTGNASGARVLKGIAQGARGYLDVKMLHRFLTKSVRAVAAGESWVSRAMVAKLIDQLARVMAQDTGLHRA